MSRSNPTDNNTPNPAVRWFEWNGEKGNVRYYDKDKKENVDMPMPFTFLLLDELGSVRGWDDSSQSGIYSNEVRDTRQDALIVKSFKGGVIAEGFYKDIKDRVNTAGGQFVSNCYIAFKNGDDKLAIGSIRFKGAALGAWMEFRKEHRGELYSKAFDIFDFTEGKKGRVIFRVPKFRTKDVSAATNDTAVTLDQTLQEFLTGYLTRTKRDQVETAQHVHHDDAPPPDHYPVYAPNDDDIPFAILLPLLGVLTLGVGLIA